MTPDEFATRARDIVANGHIRFMGRPYVDHESIHVDHDELCFELLRSLGYGEGVEVMTAEERWYA